jgi:hypothetical protein
VGGRIKGTDTIKFIYKRQVPQERFKDVTYGQFVCTECPEKKEKNRTRFTIGGDQINYPGEVATPTADLLVAKILFNSTISTPGAKFMTMDISNFYWNLPLPRPEYIRIKISNIPEEIINKYHLQEKAIKTGHVYFIDYMCTRFVRAVLFGGCSRKGISGSSHSAQTRRFSADWDRATKNLF